MSESELNSAVVVLWSRRQRNISRIVLPSYGFFIGEQQRINVLESLKLRLVYSLYHIPEERNQHYSTIQLYMSLWLKAKIRGKVKEV